MTSNFQKTFTKKSLDIIFHEKEVRGDLHRFVTKEDILTLLNRLPLEEYQQLKTVTFETCGGAYQFGYVFYKRVKGIVLCDQPLRMGMKEADAKRGHLIEYGGLNNMKWPIIAIRRYMLYNVFLHELRHTHIVNPHKKLTRHKIPFEKLANEYSDFWRGELYKDKFDHHDPVHNLPTLDEQEHLKLYWPSAMKHLQKGIIHKSKKQYNKALKEYINAKKYIEKYGTVFPINHDLIKIEESIRNLQAQAYTISISKKMNTQLFNKAKALIENQFNGVLFRTKNYIYYGQNSYFEIGSDTLRVFCNEYYGTGITLENIENITASQINLITKIKSEWKSR